MFALIACSAPAAQRSTPLHEPPPAAPAVEEPRASTPETVGRTEPAALDPVRCTSDADCVVSNFAGCCACPQCAQGAPRALNAAALRQEQEGCPRDCNNAGMCGLAGMCPPGEDAAHFAAPCRAGSCVLERR
jgi:hypothetical protein